MPLKWLLSAYSYCSHGYCREGKPIHNDRGTGEPGKISILGFEIDDLDQDGVLERIDAALGRGESIQIATANPEMALAARGDERFRAAIRAAELITADGVGVRLAGRLIRGVRVPRVTGVELAERLLFESVLRGYRVFLLGGKPGVAQAAAERTELELGAVVAGSHHGYFDDPDPVFELLAQTRPNVILVGMGSPRQELFIAESRSRPELGPAAYMGVGGSLDVLAGTVKRAPGFFQATGTEWLCRVISNPARLRRIKGFPFFVLWALKEGFMVRTGLDRRRA